jgi:hypothetical protein
MADFSDVPMLVQGMPEPPALQRRIKDAIEQGWDGLRRERGEVTRPEDTYRMQRALAHTRDLCAGYAAAFAAGSKLAHQLQEEDLVDAVGEQGGIPNQGMTIPDAEGDVQLALEYANQWKVDVDQLLTVLGNEMAQAAEAATGVAPGDLARMITQTVYETVRSWGTLTPQVTKVRKYADSLARQGNDHSASIVNSALTSTREYKGVGYKRKDPQ